MADQKRYNKSNNRNRNNNRNHSNNKGGSNNRGGSGGQKGRKPTPPAQQKQPATGGNQAQTQSKAETSNDLLIFIVFLVALAGFFLARKFYFTPEKNTLYSNVSNRKFMKEGKLTFLNAQDESVIIGIDIEIAKSTYEIERGLMYRRSLPANGGMLFIFQEEGYRTFWMKNTYLALDIIFLNGEKEIIRIAKKTIPLSEMSIPSGGKAQYVVEVLAGFTDAYQIHIGDHISFD